MKWYQDVLLYDGIMALIMATAILQLFCDMAQPKNAFFDEHIKNGFAQVEYKNLISAAKNMKKLYRYT